MLTWAPGPSLPPEVGVAVTFPESPVQSEWPGAWPSGSWPARAGARQGQAGDGRGTGWEQMLGAVGVSGALRGRRAGQRVSSVHRSR